MAARPRKRRSDRELPPNLYLDRGHYRYRNPTTGKRYTLGTDRARAIAEAVEANAALAGIIDRPRLLDRMSDEPEHTLSAWIERFAVELADRQLAAGTAEAYGRYLARVDAALGNMPIASISTRHIADLLAPIRSEHPRTAAVLRSLLGDLFRSAIAAGWCTADPVAATRSVRVTVQRARLTLEHWQAMHRWSSEHQPPWATRLLELAILTGQRREDLREMRFRDIVDGRLCVVQGKTGARVALHLGLRLDAIGLSLEEVITRCRDACVSPYLLHHSTHTGRAAPGHRIRPATLSSAIAEARDAVDIITPPDRTPPTLHECRSLAARLYAAEGIDPQALLGHARAEMTAVYRDVRGAEWTEVRGKLAGK